MLCKNTVKETPETVYGDEHMWGSDEVMFFCFIGDDLRPCCSCTCRLSSVISGGGKKKLPYPQSYARAKAPILFCFFSSVHRSTLLRLHGPTPPIYSGVAGSSGRPNLLRISWTQSKRGESAQSRQQPAEPPSTVRDRKLEEELREQLQPGR